MKTYIEELGIRGFKSFNRKSDIQFTNKLNCIVGANGSGKSNILDSLCFVLGRLSTKSIRAENNIKLRIYSPQNNHSLANLPFKREDSKTYHAIILHPMLSPDTLESSFVLIRKKWKNVWRRSRN